MSARPLHSATEAESLKADRTTVNRANAQHSSGPTSPQGKAKVSLNAVKTGLTGRTVILPTDDANQYQALLLAYQKEFKPAGPEELALVQSIVDTRWRLDRIPGLEMALINIGCQEFADRHPEQVDSQPIMIEMQIRLDYEKQFRNLNLQEARLVRRREKEMAELRRLQQERKAAETTAQAEGLDQAVGAYLLAHHRNQPFDLSALGFEFSNQQFEAHLASLTPARRHQLLQGAQKGAVETMQAVA